MKITSIFDLNMILQIIIFLLLLTGIFYVMRRKKDFNKHRLFMGSAIGLNVISIFFIMGRSFLTYFSLISEKYYELTPLVTWGHSIIGGLAMLCGITFLFKHPRMIRRWMRFTAVLWLVSLCLGIFFYSYYYLKR